MTRYKRRTIVVHPKVQVRLLLHEWLHFVVIILSLAAALFLPLVLRLNSTQTGWMEQMNLGRTILFLHAHLWPVLLLVFILLSLHSLIISNRIVGPLPRFHSAIQAFVRGEGWRSPRARKGDFLFEDLKLLSDSLALLQQNLHRVRKEHQDLQQLVERVVPDLERARLPDRREVDLLRLRRQCARMENALRDLDRGIDSEGLHRQNSDEDVEAPTTISNLSSAGKGPF